MADAARSPAAPAPLSLAFMRDHPARAAQVLESLLPADAGQLFARSPARLAALVLAAMMPHRAARCVQDLDDARVLELLAPMATQPTVALLRQLPEARRQALIKGLPTAAALASALMLGYANDTLGAWADPDVLMLEAERRVGDALARVRATPPAHGLVFVADAERRLIGSVSLGALLHAPDTATLASLAQPSRMVLAAHAPLAATADHPGWLQSSLLPVLEPGQRLVGVMTHDGLTRALRRATAAPAETPADTSVLVLLARAYWQTLSGLVNGGLGLLPSVGLVSPVNQGAARSPELSGASGASPTGATDAPHNAPVNAPVNAPR